MRRNLTPTAVGAAALALLAGASSTFAAVMWSPPAGNSPDGRFSYSGGGSDNGLFGTPTVTNSGFLFFPADFEAESLNGVADMTRDRLFVRLDANPVGGVPGEFDKIVFRETGDYGLLGPGGSVAVTGGIFVTVLDPDFVGKRDFNAALVTTPGFPVTSGSGLWSGTFAVDLPAGVQSVMVVLNNNLLATSAPGGASFIQKKFVEGVAIDVVIPEPTTVAAALAAAAGMLARRRR